jgi:RNA polymerase sigma-70 factor (ECF subfamily)
MTTTPETFENYRPLLFSIAYRMLGSVMEAEDMVQEAYLRYEAVSQNEIRSPKAFLTTVITRLCLDELKSAKTQREQYIGTWLPEPLLTAPSPSAIVGKQESISMAFLVLLEHLSPMERAVFLLREVFDYPYEDIARMVDKSEANCRQYYHRAKQYLVERRPRFEPSPEESRRLIEGFLQAADTGAVDILEQLLAEDIVVYGDGGGKAPAARKPIIGREAAARVLRGGLRFVPADAKFKMVEINGAPALMWGNDTQVYGVMQISVSGGLVREIHAIFNPDKLQHLVRS